MEPARRHPKAGTQKGRGGRWIAALCLVGLVVGTRAIEAKRSADGTSLYLSKSGRTGKPGPGAA